MRKDEEASIFSRYFGAEPFADRFATDSARALDVIIPIVHTNELWRSNLTSIYREIPVNRLLIGDGGCIDEFSGDCRGSFRGSRCSIIATSPRSATAFAT